MMMMLLATAIGNFTQDLFNHLIQIVGNPMWIGLMIIFFVVILAFSLYLSLDVALILLIPTVFIASVFISGLRLIFAIVLGILIAIGVLRLVRR